MSETTLAPEELILDAPALAAKLSDERPADAVEVLNRHAPTFAATVLEHLPPERAVDILDQSGLDNAPEIVEALPRDRAVSLLTGMSGDRSADILRQLEKAKRAGLLGQFDAETRGNLQRLLAYPEGSAGSIMTTEFVSVPSTWTIAEVLHHIRMVERTRETVYSIYVLDPFKKTLLHAIPLRRLISGDPHAKILSAAPARRRPITVAPLADRMEAARLISKYDLLAVPVVDAAGRVIGIVTVDDVIDAIVQESTEDVQKFGGVAALDEPYLRIGFLQMIMKRGGWLCALFLSEMLTASAMQNFQTELEKAIVLTCLFP